MRVGYARISTSDQSPALQEDALQKADCEKVFLEVASGSRSDRPQLKAALAFLREGDQLVVWRLDRLGRSLRHLVDLAETLEERGIQLVSLQDQIDTTTATGRLIFHVFGALAEFERSLLRERVQAGLDAARARGRKGGRKPKLSEEKRKAIRALYNARENTIEEIAEMFGVSKATIDRCVHERAHYKREKKAC